MIVKASNIPGAGLGLFTTKDIKAQEIITGYGGSFFINPKSKYLLRDQYGITWDGEKEFDARTELGRFANDADFEKEKHGFENNSEFCTLRELGVPPVLIATRDIAAGEEIFVGYGPKYWGYWGENK